MDIEASAENAQILKGEKGFISKQAVEYILDFMGVEA